MTNIPLSPDQRAARWGTVAKWAAFGLVGYLFAPFAVATITGLLGLIVAGGIVATAWFMMPVVEQAATNLRLKMIKAEAARNPIETLQNEYMRRQLLLGERKEAIERFGTKTRTFGDKLDGFKRDYPSEAAKYQEIYDKMRTLLQRQRDQWHQADAQLTAFDREIDKAKAMWSMAQAAADAKAGTDLDSDAFYAKLKTDTALDSIQDGMNSAFSQMDTLEMESDNIEVTVTPSPTAALPAPTSSTTVDAIVDAPVTTKVRNRR